MDSTWAIELKVEPKQACDAASIAHALESIVASTPGLSFEIDPESRELFLRGQSELQLDQAISTLSSQVPLNVGPPQVAYRETVVGSAEFTGPRCGAFKVQVRVEPNDDGLRNSFASLISESAPYAPAILTTLGALRRRPENGTRIGAPLIGTKVTLLDAFVETDRTTSAELELATRPSIHAALQHADVRILEPTMLVAILLPTLALGRLSDLIGSRRGQIVDRGVQDACATVHAHIPVATLFGFSSSLQAIAGVTASACTTFLRYAEVPELTSTDPGNFPPAVGMRA